MRNKNLKFEWPQLCTMCSRCASSFSRSAVVPSTSACFGDSRSMQRIACAVGTARARSITPNACGPTGMISHGISVPAASTSYVSTRIRRPLLDVTFSYDKLLLPHVQMPRSEKSGVRRYTQVLEPRDTHKPTIKRSTAPDTRVATLLRDHGQTMQPLLRWVYRHWR